MKLTKLLSLKTYQPRKLGKHKNPVKETTGKRKSGEKSLFAKSRSRSQLTNNHFSAKSKIDRSRDYLSRRWKVSFRKRPTLAQRFSFLRFEKFIYLPVPPARGGESRSPTRILITDLRGSTAVERRRSRAREGSSEPTAQMPRMRFERGKSYQKYLEFGIATLSCSVARRP